MQYLFPTITRLGILLIFFFVLSLSFAHAQNNFSTRIQVTPQTPGSQEEYTVRLVSSETDLNRATITWYVNDEIKLQNIGATGFRSKTGFVGEPIDIRAEIETIEGKALTRRTIIRPQEVDLLWHGYTYTPPLYKGKKLPSSSSLVRITAIPNIVDVNGEKIDADKLVYTWSQWGIVLGSASGFGKQSIILEGAQIEQRPLQVSVIVSSLDKSVEARENLQIPVTDVEALLYEHKPLEGVNYSKTIEIDHVLDKEEIMIMAEPYYFSREDLINGNVHFEWEVNNRPVSEESGGTNRAVTLRREGEGTAFLSVKITNQNLPMRVFQDVKKIISIIIPR